MSGSASSFGFHLNKVSSKPAAAQFGGFLSGATTAAGALAGATLVGKGVFVAIEGASTTGGIVFGAAAQAIAPGVAAGVNAIDVAQTIKSEPASNKKEGTGREAPIKDTKPKESTSQ